MWGFLGDFGGFFEDSWGILLRLLNIRGFFWDSWGILWNSLEIPEYVGILGDS